MLFPWLFFRMLYGRCDEFRLSLLRHPRLSTYTSIYLSIPVARYIFLLLRFDDIHDYTILSSVTAQFLDKGLHYYVHTS